MPIEQPQHRDLATIDLDVSDDAGEPVIRTQSFGTGAL